MPGSIRERKPGVWTVRVDAARNPRTGERVQINETVYGTKRQAQKRVAEMAARYHGRVVQSGTITLDELFERWIAAPARGGTARAETTRYQERKRYQRHVSPVIGDRDITSIRAVELTSLYDDLLQGAEVGGELRNALSPKSVHRVHEQLRAMLAWAKRRELLDENPAERADCPGISLIPPQAPTLRAVEAFLKHLWKNDLELWLAIRLTATLAMRRSELLALRWSDVDLKQSQVRIEHGLVKIPTKGFIETETKTGQSATATFKIDVELRDALSKHLKRQKESAKELEVDFLAEGFVFSSDETGIKPWHPDTLTSRVSRERQKVKAASGITLKSLRAFVASELEAEGADVTTAQAVLRHRTATTTTRYYRAARYERVRQATENLGKRLGEGSENG